MWIADKTAEDNNLSEKQILSRQARLQIKSNKASYSFQWQHQANKYSDI